MLQDRFWPRVNRRGPTPRHRRDLGRCWVWTGKTFASGYGQFWYEGRTRRAHIVSWVWENGPVPDGLELDHLCRNKTCVRPSHIEAVPHRTNSLRSPTGFASVNARKNRCPRDHLYAGDNVRLDTKGRRRCRACNREQRHARYLRTGV